MSMMPMPFTEMNSVMVEVGSPDNQEDDGSIQSENQTVTIFRDDETALNDRINALERVMIKVLSEMEDNKQQVREVKKLVEKTQSANVPYSSTPHKGGLHKEVIQRCERLFEDQPESAPFFASTMALISVAKTPLIQYKIKAAIESEVNQQLESNYDVELSDGELSEDDRESRKTDLLTKSLPDLVKSMLEPVVVNLIHQNGPLTHAKIKDLTDEIVLSSGTLSLPRELRTQFKGEILLHLSQFVGKADLNKTKIIAELTDLLYSLVTKIRNTADPVTGVVDKNDSERPPEGQKIQLSAAELKALTCYGSGEDEDSEEFIEEFVPETPDQPETAINDKE